MFLLTRAPSPSLRAAVGAGPPANRARAAAMTATGASVAPLAPTPLAVASAARANADDPLPPHLSAYRPCVSVLLVNPHTRRVFCATRVGDPHKTWQTPQGGIDPGEAALAAALRELEEETAIVSVRVVGATGWLSYDFPDWVRARLHPGMLKYKGQAQRWFCALYTGPTAAGPASGADGADGADKRGGGDGPFDGCAEVDLSGGGAHAREFSAWAWRDLERLPLDVTDFKKGVYAAAAAELGALLDELEQGGALARVAAEARAAEEAGADADKQRA